MRLLTEQCCNRGKKTSRETRSSYNELTNEFNFLIEKPSEYCIKESVENMEHIIVLLYDKSSECLHVDAARKRFVHEERTIQLKYTT